MAAVLAGHGIGRGRTVALLSGNRPEVLAARYAAGLLGARVVFLYDGMAAGTLARIAGSVETALLLVDPALHDTARALLRHTRGPLPEVMTLGEGAAELGADLVAACAALPATPEVPSAARPEDDWCIRHTGGTTGIPKGVRMRHAPYAALVLHQRMEAAGDPPRFLACTPLAHLAGILADTTLAAGGTVVLHRAFDPTAVLAAVARHRITHLWLLPRSSTGSSTTPPSPPPTSLPSAASPTAAVRPRPHGWRGPPRSSARSCSGCTARPRRCRSPRPDRRTTSAPAPADGSPSAAHCPV